MICVCGTFVQNETLTGELHLATEQLSVVSNEKLALVSSVAIYFLD